MTSRREWRRWQVARNEVFISARPDAVFEVLGDPRTYGEWVFGSREIRAADEHWPAPGAAFDHSVGKAPAVMLELRARARPLPTARITLHLQPDRDGTRVTMIEEPANRLLSLAGGPV